MWGGVQLIRKNVTVWYGGLSAAAMRNRRQTEEELCIYG